MLSIRTIILFALLLGLSNTNEFVSASEEQQEYDYSNASDSPSMAMISSIPSDVPSLAPSEITADLPSLIPIISDVTGTISKNSKSIPLATTSPTITPLKVNCPTPSNYRQKYLRGVQVLLHDSLNKALDFLSKDESEYDEYEAALSDAPSLSPTSWSTTLNSDSPSLSPTGL
jgi:hypothetical protein